MDVTRPTTAAAGPAPHATASFRSWLPVGMSARVRGLLAGVVLASGVTTVAVAQQPLTTKRAATLLPPQLLEPGDMPAVARGAIGDSPSFPLASTPVTRPGSKPPLATGPAWLSGVDPNLLPASGTQPAKPDNLRPQTVTNAAVTSARLTPPPPLNIPVNDTARSAKGPAALDRPMPGGDAPNSPDANAPLRGTAANGAPVLAGPPAYRWYGYGSVTPGANAYAPSGQYPRASANWYSTTGATPGAFPVPVMNPLRPPPGSEPPTYLAGTVPVQRGPIPTVPPERMTARESVNVIQPLSKPQDLRPTTGWQNPPPPNQQPVGSMAVPKPGVSAPVFTNPKPPTAPTFAPAPLPAGAGLGAMSPPAPVPPVGVPTLTPLPALPSITAKPSPPLPVKPAESVVAVPLPPLPTPTPTPEVKRPIAGLVPVSGNSPITATKLPVPASPAALPTSVTDDVRWQSTPETAIPPLPGTWVPASNAPRVPDFNPGEPGATNTALKAVTARAQMPDQNRQPDPAATLIHAMCRGRADGVDVRWTGSNRLTVCFETRTEPEASKLVRDISARPELGPLQIDFCVLVK